MAVTLFHGGVVYAPGHPEATAVLVQDTQVAWVGDDSTAHLIAPDAATVFLDGGLITALPVDLRIGALDDPDNGLVSARRADVVFTTAQLLEDPQILAAAVGETGSDLARSITVLCDADSTPIVHLLAALQAQGTRVGRVRLQLARGAEFPATLLEVLPQMVNVIVDISDGAPGVPLHGFVSSGFVFGLISDVSSWDGMRAAVNHRADPMSGRAAYQAYTRGAWRIVGKQDSGIVGVGQTAHLGIWQSQSLTIQVPRMQDNLGSWSTDPRARSGMLPDLSEDAELPRLVSSVINGRLSGPEYTGANQ